MATPTDQAANPAAVAGARPGNDAMPLWGGPDRSAPQQPLARPEIARSVAGRAPSGPAPTPEDVSWAEFDEVLAAWDELGFPVQAAEVRAAVAADVALLNEPPLAVSAATATGTPWVPIVAPAGLPAAAPDSGVARAVPVAAAAVEAAEAGTNAHADTLQDHPEWQRIQTIRGALRHVWDVMKEKAGAYWDTLRADVRFQGFWKTAAIRACEAISVHAAALAHRLRPGTGDLPAADALLKLSDATLTYSTVAAAEADSTPASPVVENAADAAEPAMQRLVERRTPTAYATRHDAVRAAEEVTARFQKWINTPMGQEAVGSSHMRVMAFRDAWRQLPPHDSGPGPAVGPYGAVAERAQALVASAVRSARFAPADVQALQGLAQAAEKHSARLAVTLPPGTAGPAQRAAAPAPRVATPTTPAARTPRASA